MALIIFMTAHTWRMRYLCGFLCQSVTESNGVEASEFVADILFKCVNRELRVVSRLDEKVSHENHIKMLSVHSPTIFFIAAE